MSELFTATLADRAELAMSQLRLEDERAHQMNPRYGATDSTVLDAIDANTTGQCDGICAGNGCCDYDRLSTLVWAAVQGEFQ